MFFNSPGGWTPWPDQRTGASAFTSRAVRFQELGVSISDGTEKNFGFMNHRLPSSLAFGSDAALAYDNALL